MPVLPEKKRIPLEFMQAKSLLNRDFFPMALFPSFLGIPAYPKNWVRLSLRFLPPKQFNSDFSCLGWPDLAPTV